jgi:hypothetical protein
MHRTSLILALVLALTVAGIATVEARTQVPSLTVTPTGGNQFQTFTVVGMDFVPGTVLSGTFLSPDGEEFPYSTGSGPATITVPISGGFSVTLVPAVDFAGSRAGLWSVSFCSVESGECWRRDFTVSR